MKHSVNQSAPPHSPSNLTPASTLTPEQEEAIATESQHLENVLRSLAEQSATATTKLALEAERARELTSALVATRRAEDKQMLASDEAVSHAIKERKANELNALEKLMDRPYFARIEVKEETESGSKTFEYKIGFRANPESRIIDWRKAPLSKIYYNYQEGDEYSELVQGRERCGRVILRNRVEIERGILRRVHCRLGDFVQKNGSWSLLEGGRGRVSSSYRQLPSILSLITADQFALITEDQDTALLIQGVAGSGKTTVALHRLSYLVKGEAPHLREDECAIVVKSRALRLYIRNSLPQLDLDKVSVHLFEGFAIKMLGWSSSDNEEEADLLCKRLNVSQALPPSPASVDRVKRSLALLFCLEETTHRRLQQGEGISATSIPNQIRQFHDLLLESLADSQKLLELDETRLLDRDLIKRAKERVVLQSQHGHLDQSDFPLILRVAQIFSSKPNLSSSSFAESSSHGTTRKQFEHLVVDEVQDYSPPQLAAIIGSVRNLSGLTLVGDLGQQVGGGLAFPVWEKLREFWGVGPELARFVSLEVSHRSTEQIMRFAHAIRGDKFQVGRGQRQGRIPIWFRCDREARGVQTTIEWLTKALDRYPTSLTAVLTRSDEEARMVLSLLKPTFGEIIRAGDSMMFSLEEGIVVTSVEHVKGLEFCNVVIWNPTRRHYHEDPDDRNLLYVAATRAEENLCLVSWGAASPFLPPFQTTLGSQNAIVRGIRLSDEEDDDERQPQLS